MIKFLFNFCVFFIVGISVAVAQYPIGTRAFSFTDAARSNRTVDGQVYYPAVSAGTNTAVASGQFPLIVFGHGFAMQYSEYKSIWDSLASRGYIVVFPKTESSTIPFPSHENFAKDLSFLVNKYYSEGTNSSSVFYQKVINKSAIMGHSMGGGASVWATAYNPNVTTMVTLAPVNANDPVQSIVHAKHIKQPVLLVPGSEDCVADGSQSTGNADSIYNRLDSAIYKVVAKITGADHCDFASANGFTCQFGQGSCTGSISQAVQQQRTFRLIVPWLDYHLKGICSQWTVFKTYLTSQPATIHTYRAQLTLPLTASPIVSYNGTDTFCGNINAVLTATSSGFNCGIKWYKNGVFTGVTTSVLNATSAGSYAAYTVNADGINSVVSNSVSLYSDTPVSATLGGDTITDLCQKDTINIFSLNTAQTYLWKKDNQNFSNSASVQLTQAGSYQLYVTNGVCKDSSVLVQIFPKNTISAEILSDTVLDLCYNDSIHLNSKNTAAAYQWYKDNLQYGNSQSVIAATSGFYQLVTGNALCKDTSIGITILPPAIPTPLISVNGNQFSTGNYTTYQWYKDNVAIPAANAAIYTATDSGIYQVMVTNGSFCTNFSDTIQYGFGRIDSTIGIISIDNNATILYNNPFENQLKITADVDFPLEIFAIDGKKIVCEKQKNEYLINTEKWANGYYLAKVAIQQKLITFKLLKK